MGRVAASGCRAGKGLGAAGLGPGALPPVLCGLRWGVLGGRISSVRGARAGGRSRHPSLEALPWGIKGGERLGLCWGVQSG